MSPRNNQPILHIFGSGPAGLAAALYAVRAGISVLIHEKNIFGGDLNEINKLENFPGFSGHGKDLAASQIENLKSLDVKFEYTSEDDPSIEELNTRPNEYVLLATGTEPIPLDFDPKIPVSHCATCDAPLYKDKSVAVIGGGNSAVSESLELSPICKSIDLFSNTPLHADELNLEKLRATKNVHIHENHPVSADELKDFACAFVCIGHRPAASMLDKKYLDKKGSIVTDEKHRVFGHIFAAGSVRSGVLNQCITSAADGAAAAVDINNFILNS